MNYYYATAKQLISTDEVTSVTLSYPKIKKHYFLLPMAKQLV